ncbi:hypothetical protein CJU90_5598 [Yarrowia sp. C11]|nr:hypothetical protein CJU90_5598 [Yarrowia sp. C11]KAG5364182.1 hypothetical protein CKK34_2975 [Yarrowia sp. E02]
MSSVNSVAPIHPIRTYITPGAINVTTTAGEVSPSAGVGESNNSTNSTVSHIHPIRTYITPQSSNEQASTATSGAAGSTATASKSGAASASPASSSPSNANGGVSLTVAGSVVIVGFVALLM